MAPASPEPPWGLVGGSPSSQAAIVREAAKAKAAARLRRGEAPGITREDSSDEERLS
jgi:hypothetical protein